MTGDGHFMFIIFQFPLSDPLGGMRTESAAEEVCIELLSVPVHMDETVGFIFKFRECLIHA